MSAPTSTPVRDTGHGDWDALAVGWALSTLDAADEARFAVHLPGCERCAATVRQSLHTVADLAYALPDEVPPPVLKERVMAAVGAESRVGPPAAPVARPAPEGPADTSTDWFARPRGAPAPEPPAAGTVDGAPAPPRTARLRGPEPEAPAAAVPAPSGQESGRAESTEPAGPAAGDAAGPTTPGDLPGRTAPGGGVPGRTGPGALPGRTAPGGTLPGRATPGGDVPGGTGRTADRDGPPPAGPPGRPASAGIPTGGGTEPARPDGRGRHASLDEDTSGDTVPPFRQPGRRWVQWTAAAAVVALLAALVVWNARLRADQAALRRVVAQRSAEVAERDALVAQRDAAIRQLTANGPARIAALTANGKPSPARRATVVVRGDQIEIITEGLGASPANTTYWLWTLRCDGPAPSDLKPVRGFTVPQAQFSVRSIGSDPGFATATCFAISEELGTATPTAPREVVAVGQPE